MHTPRFFWEVADFFIAAFAVLLAAKFPRRGERGLTESKVREKNECRASNG